MDEPEGALVLAALKGGQVIRQIASIVGGLVLALSVGACGGDDSTTDTRTQSPPAGPSAAKDGYVCEIREALAPSVSGAERLNLSEPDEFAGELARAQRSLTETARRLDAIDPPPDVANLHRRFVNIARNLAQGTGEAREVAKQEGYRSARKKALKADARYGQGLDKLTPLYRAKGYPVGSGSEEILCPGG